MVVAPAPYGGGYGRGPGGYVPYGGSPWGYYPYHYFWWLGMPRPYGYYGGHSSFFGGLFMAMLPGAAVRAPAGDYRHHLLCRDLAAGMPFAASGVGDPQGAEVGTLDG